MSKPTYVGYKRVQLLMSFVDNGLGEGYLRLMWPDGTYVKIFEYPDDSLYEAMQDTLNELPRAQAGEEGGR